MHRMFYFAKKKGSKKKKNTWIEGWSASKQIQMKFEATKMDLCRRDVANLMQGKHLIHQSYTKYSRQDKTTHMQNLTNSTTRLSPSGFKF